MEEDFQYLISQAWRAVHLVSGLDLSCVKTGLHNTIVLTDLNSTSTLTRYQFVYIGYEAFQVIPTKIVCRYTITVTTLLFITGMN